MKLDQVIEEIKDIIEKKLLVDTSDLASDENIEEALGIDLEIDLPLIISEIEKKYEISSEGKSLLLQATTLHQLASIVTEETELG